jgi:hypothetical protein
MRQILLAQDVQAGTYWRGRSNDALWGIQQSGYIKYSKPLGVAASRKLEKKDMV